MTLDYVIATHKPTGIESVAAMNLPRLDGVRYIVSWQDYGHADIPASLMREDVEILLFDGTGVSANRNNGIDHATADIVAFADDDNILYPDGIRALMRRYEEHPDDEFVTFVCLTPLSRTLPHEAVELHLPLPKNYCTGTWELSFRRSAGLRFCPAMGFGAPLFDCGEDEALLLTALHRGLRCRFIPVTVAAHPHISTGAKRGLTAGQLRSSGAIIAMSNPYTAFLRIPLKALRLARAGQAPFFKALRYCAEGVLRTPALLRENRDTLW